VMGSLMVIAGIIEQNTVAGVPTQKLAISSNKRSNFMNVRTISVPFN
jgi:hypothetical protein